MEGEKETESDYWQHNKSKGQHLTSLTTIESLFHTSIYLKKTFKKSSHAFCLGTTCETFRPQLQSKLVSKESCRTSEGRKRR